MAIQIRRGASEDFDASKMVAGELGVATDDSHKMWATGQAGDSWELANKEDLDAEVEAREALAETVETQGESLELKAEVDGMYDDLYAGGLTTDKHQTDKTPYLFRKTAGNLSRVGDRCYDTIVGASVGENQLYGKTGNSTNKGITFTNVDGKITISGVNDGTGTSYYTYNFTTSIPANHVVAFRSGVDGGSSTTYDAQLIANGGSNELSYDGKSYLVTKKNYPWTGCNLDVRTGYNADQNPVTFAPEIIDLTALLGSSIADYIYSLESATAGSGIAKLREWGFLRGYQAYNAGAIESVEVTGKKVVGFNQWDEEWELGYWRVQNGTSGSSSLEIRCKNFIPVIPNATYYFHKSSGGSTGDILYYDSDKQYTGVYRTSAGNGTFTVPSDCYYIKINVGNTYGATYNHDICINLSSDRNGEYEAYVTQTYDYGDDVLNGIFKLDSNNELYADGDVKTSDGVITRKYKKVTYDGSSDEDWRAETSPSVYEGTNFYIARPSDTLPFVRTNDYARKFMTPMAKTNINMGDDRLTPTEGWLNFIVGAKLNISAVSDFRTYLASHPIVLQYPIVETTEQGDPFPSPQVCYPDGTEEYVTSNNVPVGHETSYPYDLKGLVEGLIDVPDVPSSNGTYVLKATRSASGIVYNWEASSSGAVTLSSPLTIASPTSDTQEEGETE